MDSITIDSVSIGYEKAATAAVYARIATGSPEQCGCPDCRNFAMQRLEIHPPKAMTLFKVLGIDFRKESEIWNAERFYNGWFHFIGKITTGEENIVQISPNYKLEFSAQRDLLPTEFGNEIVCQVSFYVENVQRIISETGLPTKADET